MTDTVLKSIRDAGKDIAAYLAGDAARVTVETFRVPDDVDVKAIRAKLALSQAQFAQLFGFSLSAVQAWERSKHRRRPTRTARVLLTALDRKPEAVLSALATAD
jgi:putative transcriptional regulator